MYVGLVQSDWCPCKKGTQTHREGQQGEDTARRWHLHAKHRGLGGPKPCGTGSPASSPQLEA